MGCCELAREHREQACPQAALRAGRALAWGPLYSRALPKRPNIVKFPVGSVWHDVAYAKLEKCATRNVYSDGSAKGCF